MSGVIPAVLSVVSTPATLPVEVDDARRHLRGLDTEEDDLIESWILAARDFWEGKTGRPIIQRQYDLLLDGFPAQTGTWPARIELPAPPLVSVDTVTYIASDGTETAFTDGASPETSQWRVVAPAGLYAPRGWIEPIADAAWPTPRTQSGAVRVRFTAGYATSSAGVPPMIKATLLLLVGQYDQFRSNTHYSEGARLDVLPMGVEQQLQDFILTNQSSIVLRSVWP